MPQESAYSASAKPSNALTDTVVFPLGAMPAARPIPTPAPIKTAVVDEQLDELSELLDRAEAADPAQASADELADHEIENHLAQVRLGIASSLFTALRCKDAATAAHSVRVALGASAWASAISLPNAERDAIELAALLHDIGKIGVPDSVLLKPSALTAEERVTMSRHQTLGLEILQSCCASQEVLEMVRYAPAWYDGSKTDGDHRATQLPRGARMLAILDAFDSMTTPQVYRAAMSRDLAIKELCDFAGLQFDPQLVYNFAELHATDQQKLHFGVARRWLQELDPGVANVWWRQQSQPDQGNQSADSLHQYKLLENMYDGIIFLDANLQVVLWNRGAERITGISSSSILQRPFSPDLVRMRDQHGGEITLDRCPIAHCLGSGVQSLRRLVVRSRNGRDLAVDANLIPVVGPDGTTQGVSLQLHDASGEASLEERCHHLYEQAIRDPLTQLANRAEFDRVHTKFVEAHLERRLPCSLIMCDIDRFKLVNDTYGHQAGDEVIRSFAQILKSSCRPGDLVARYGGEEFVMLCADCTNETASARAEIMRTAFADVPQPSMGSKSSSASFGVSEIQSGDTAQTMLNRADRALLMAKEGGRNMVIQLGGGISEEPKEVSRGWRFWQKSTGGPLVDRYLITNVPPDITVEKLRGFVSDHHADISVIEGGRIELVTHPGKFGKVRRRSDRPISLVVELIFTQDQRHWSKEIRAEKFANGRPMVQTCIHVVIKAQRDRDRRQSNAVEQAKLVMASLRSYLMATETEAIQDKDAFKKASNMLSPWRTKK
ncbi:MAG TPA: diguanylate cyclase [Pirellulales bacterium]